MSESLSRRQLKNELKEARRKRSRVLGLETLGNRCVWCGATENLEFDHKMRESKDPVFKNGIFKLSWARASAELAKCQLLCKPCHVAKTQIENIYLHRGASFLGESAGLLF